MLSFMLWRGLVYIGERRYCVYAVIAEALSEAEGAGVIESLTCGTELGQLFEQLALSFRESLWQNCLDLGI